LVAHFYSPTAHFLYLLLALAGFATAATVAALFLPSDARQAAPIPAE